MGTLGRCVRQGEEVWRTRGDGDFWQVCEAGGGVEDEGGRGPLAGV